MRRSDQRDHDQIRPCSFEIDFLLHPKGSVLVRQGNTRVLCAVSIVPGVPRWMKDQGINGGWLTSEYQMLPSSTNRRTPRDASRGRINGRSQEIQRLIGRCLRAAVDLKKLKGCTVYVDCDVIDADGGTRCASINGASVALGIAFQKMVEEKRWEKSPMSDPIAAISVGMLGESVLLDLCYKEDVAADVDMNIVMAKDGRFIEIQGTAEGQTFSQEQMENMLQFARKGIKEIILLQCDILACS